MPPEKPKPPSKLKEFLQDAPNLAGSIARAVAASLDTEQPGVALSTAISFVGALRSGRIVWRNIQPNIYTCAVAPSGVGKSRAQTTITKIAEAAGISDLLMGRPASDAGLIRRLTDRPRQLLIWDEFGLALSEMIKSSSSYRVAIVETIMDLFSSSGRTYIGREYAEKSRKDIEKPMLSIAAASTPVRFYESLTEDFVLDGFLSRWLIFPAESHIKFQEPEDPREDFGPEILAHAEAAPHATGNFAASFDKRDPLSLQIDDELLQIFKSDAEKKITGAKTEVSRILFSRLFEQAIKLCLIFSKPSGECDDEVSGYCYQLAEHLTLTMVEKCSLDLFPSRADKLKAQRAKKFEALIGDGEEVPLWALNRRALGKGFDNRETVSHTEHLLKAEVWGSRKLTHADNPKIFKPQTVFFRLKQ